MAKQQSNNDQQVDYVEFGVSDIAKTRNFYGSVFGWTFTEYGPNYLEFQDGRLTGGFTTFWSPRSGGPLVIMYADDLEATLKRVRKADGGISKEIHEFPGGRRFHFTDPDGYELAVWSKN